MSPTGPRQALLALVGGAPRELGARLVGALRHPWNATYAVGFGPPLIGANDALKARLATANGAFAKLEAYADTCLVPERERTRMFWKHRLRLRSDDRREVSRRSVEALDLTLRLHHPGTAPAAVAAALAGLVDAALPREALEARLLVRLDDPFGAGLGARLGVEEDELILELVVDDAARGAWAAWAAQLPDTRALTAS